MKFLVAGLVSMTFLSVSPVFAAAKKARKPSSEVHCTASSSSEGVSPTKFKVTEKDGVYTEEYTYKNWSFHYGHGTNKNSLSVRKDGKPVFQTLGIAELYVAVIMNPDAPEDKLSSIDVSCDE